MPKRGKYTKLGEALSQFGTQARIAKLLKVTQQTVSKKLRGECAISVSDLATIAKRAKTFISIKVGNVQVRL